MPLLSSATIVRALSIFHLTVAYYLIASPQKLADQNLVFILGESMKIPEMPSLSAPSAPTAFCGLVLALFAISDFVSATALAGADSYEGGLSTAYWSTQALVRTVFFFGITGYIYLTRPKEGLGFEEGVEDFVGGLVGAEKSGVDQIKNRLVFTWTFVGSLVWFWIFLTLRDERREAAVKLSVKRKQAEEDALLETD